VSTLRLVLATANPDKAREITRIVAAATSGRVELLARPPDAPEVDETGETLEDNARLKARALVAHSAVPAVADDTGLEVEAIGGAPGVRSARYAGLRASYDDNVAKLLTDLAAAGAAAEAQRLARFRTVALAAFPDGHEVLAEGVVEGTIALARSGSGGFGYDPVFVPKGEDRTFAQMTPEEKNHLSHRGRAFRALAAGLLQEVGSR